MRFSCLVFSMAAAVTSVERTMRIPTPCSRFSRLSRVVSGS
jgi:hypothetical protein